MADNVVPIQEALDAAFAGRTVSVVQGATHVFTQLAHDIHPNISGVRPDPMDLIGEDNAPQTLGNQLVQQVDRLIAEHADLGGLPQAKRNDFSDQVVNTLLTFSDKIENGGGGHPGYGLSGWLTYVQQLVAFLSDTAKGNFLERTFEEQKGKPETGRNFLDALLGVDPVADNMYFPIHYFGREYGPQMDAMKSMLTQKAGMRVAANDDATAKQQRRIGHTGPSLSARIVAGIRNLPQRWSASSLRAAFARSGEAAEDAQAEPVQLKQGTGASITQAPKRSIVRLFDAKRLGEKMRLKGYPKSAFAKSLLAEGKQAEVIDLKPGTLSFMDRTYLTYMNSTIKMTNALQSLAKWSMIATAAIGVVSVLLGVGSMLSHMDFGGAVPVDPTGGALPVDTTGAHAAPIATPDVHVAPVHAAPAPDIHSVPSAPHQPVHTPVVVGAPAHVDAAPVTPVASAPVNSTPNDFGNAVNGTTPVTPPTTVPVDSSLQGVPSDFSSAANPTPVGQPVNLLEGLGYDTIPANPGDAVVATVSPPSPLPAIY